MNAALPPEIQAALDRLEPAFEKAFADAIAGVTSQAAVGQIEDAIARGDIQGAVDLLQINSATFDGLQQQILLSQWAGGGLVAGPVPGLTDPFTGRAVVLGFSGFQPRAMQWAQTAGSKLVTAILSDQREGIRSFIAGSVETGQGPRSTALDIVGRLNRATGKREGGIVGLSGQQMQWVANARAELSDPATMEQFLARSANMRDLRLSRLVTKAARDGKPLASVDIDRIVQDYSNNLLKLRGEAIARTEALNSLRAGRHEGWRQAIEKGQMQASDVIVEWSATMDKRTRDSHLHLDGHKVTFGKPFKSELGSLMEFPGDSSHEAVAGDIIQCRCMAIYRRRRVTDANL